MTNSDKIEKKLTARQKKELLIEQIMMALWRHSKEMDEMILKLGEKIIADKLG